MWSIFVFGWYTFLVVGDGSLAVELDLHKATAKQAGRAAHCFLIRIFLTKKSGMAVWIKDAFISSLGGGDGDQSQLSEVCPAGRWRKRTSDLPKACSAGCGMLRGGQKEVGTCKQILEGAHRKAFLLSCDVLVINLWSLGDGWSYLLPFHVWRSHVCLGWIQKAAVEEETRLCIRALLHCVCRTHPGVSFSPRDWWCQGQYLTSPHTLVPELLFIWQKTAWPCSCCATTRVMLVGGRKQMQGIHFPAHWGNASAFVLGLMFRSLTDGFFRSLCNSCV